MRATAFGFAALAAVGVMACSRGQSRDQAGKVDDLAKDLAMAASGGISLAPASSGRATVSPLEQLRKPVSNMAPSRRATTHRKAKTVTPEVAPVVEEPAALEEMVVETPAPTPTQSADVGAAAPAPRPRPVDGATVGPQSGGDGPDPGMGTGTATAIGTVIGVILRGGTVDGDHCDPRPGQRAGGGRGRGGAIISGGIGGNAGGGVIRGLPMAAGGPSMIRGVRY